MSSRKIEESSGCTGAKQGKVKGQNTWFIYVKHHPQRIKNAATDTIIKQKERNAGIDPFGGLKRQGQLAGPKESGLTFSAEIIQANRAPLATSY